MYGCESWTIKKAECQRIDAFELWCWRRLLRVPWTARRSNQYILKEISPGCSLEGLMLKLKLQYFGSPDAIEPSHLLSPPSAPALNLSQLQSFSQWVGSSHQVVKLLEFQLKHQSLQWTHRTDLLQDVLVGSPCSPRDSEESTQTPQFKSINSSGPCFLYSPTLTSIHDHWKNHSLD